MFCEIVELAKELDDVIQKGAQLESKQLRKGLTFDPYKPTTMSNERSDIYNPYQWVDNGYMPYPVEYWRDQGKSPITESYAEVQKLYEKINFQRSTFKSLAKTIEHDLAKAGIVPAGTIHTYRNGQQYKKISDGRWEPVGDKKPIQDDPHSIERHAMRYNEIQNEMKARSKQAAEQESLKQEARMEAVKEIQNALKVAFGGKLPDNLKNHFSKISESKDMADRESGKAPEQKLKEVEQDLKNKTHRVSVKFTHNGKTYEHEFPKVNGHSPDEVTGRVMDMIKKKIPNSIVHKISASPNFKLDQAHKNRTIEQRA